MVIYTDIPLASVSYLMCSMISCEFVTMWQGVRYMLTAAEKSNQVFELVVDIYDRFVWALVISFYDTNFKHTHAQCITFEDCMVAC